MARRLVLPLLLLLVVVAQVPSSAPTTLNPLGDLFVKANDSAITTSSPSPAPSENAAAPSSKAKEEDKEKKLEKEMQDIEALKKNATARGVVSFTNGTGSYKGMPHELLEGHNKVRQRYGVPPMVWNNKLARHARRWSNAMRKDCVLKHSDSRYGESVYASKENWNATAKDALWSWTSEEPVYDKLTGNCTGGRHFNECGHFALMVAEKNQKMGCGRAECYKGGVFITCNYYLRDNNP